MRECGSVQLCCCQDQKGSILLKGIFHNIRPRFATVQERTVTRERMALQTLLIQSLMLSTEVHVSHFAIQVSTLDCWEVYRSAAPQLCIRSENRPFSMTRDVHFVRPSKVRSYHFGVVTQVVFCAVSARIFTAY